MTGLENGPEAVREPVSKPALRELEPFSYWPHYASAIPGFGGDERPHEPRYCFCTDYFSPPPGRSAYLIDISGVTVTRGEIAVHVQGLVYADPPIYDLAANTYIPLDDFAGDTISERIEFTALEGVHYALFAYFNEPSDLRAGHIGVRFEESVAGVPIHVNAPSEGVSCFAAPHVVIARRLIAAETTPAQLSLSHAQPREAHEGEGWCTRWSRVIKLEPDFARQWEAIAVLETLDLARVDAAGARALLIDVRPGVLEAVFDQHAIGFDRLALAPQEVASGAYVSEREGRFDVVVSHSMTQIELTREGALKVIGDVLMCLLVGGVAVFVMPFWTGSTLDPVPAMAAGCLDRNAIQQIAIRLIGHGYSVSQIVFPRVGRGEGEITRFLLSVRKPV